MALEIRDKETREMATEIAKRIGTSEEEAVRQALEEKRQRLRLRRRHDGGRRWRTYEEWEQMMEEKIWSKIPDELLDQPPMTKEEKEELLGYGPEGF
jgi:hypothetical protein